MERTPSRREGYERVVAQYGRPLLVYVARLLGSASEAEDVVQDVFVKFAQLWKGPLEPDARMTAWLRTTAHNLAVDAMRASARRAELHRRGAEERGLSTPPSPGQGGADAPSDGAAAAAEALASLPPRERELVVLKVYEGRSYREIAQETGLSESNVGVILHNAMRKLAAALGARRAGGEGKTT